MSQLPFESFEEAEKFFGVKIPRRFVNTLLAIDAYSRQAGLDTPEVLFDVFGILRIEGREARYQQTPIELFPFGSTGSDGIHYGFIIHTVDEQDYPSGALCPMDSDGVVLIGNDTQTLFQNLLSDEDSASDHLHLLKDLSLDPNKMDRDRYDQSGNAFKIAYKPKLGWKLIETSDGAGIFAQEYYFERSHVSNYDLSNRGKTMEQYEQLAFDSFNNGLFASQLFYLKELYWHEWTNPILAKKYLQEMLQAYEKLNRAHLYDVTKWTIDTFDKRFIF